MEFIKRYLASLTALVIALIIVFALLNFVGKKGPGVIGTASERIGALASGQEYTFG